MITISVVLMLGKTLDKVLWWDSMLEQTTFIQYYCINLQMHNLYVHTLFKFINKLPYLLERELATDSRSFFDFPDFICALRFVKSFRSMTFPDSVANLSCTIFLLAFTAR